jgi:dUTP pyrophosphatase
VSTSKGGRKPHELTNKKYGKVLVLKKHGKNSHGDILWLCKCQCGKETIRTASHLLGTPNVSCGCGNKIGKELYNWTGYEDISGSYLKRIKSNAKSKNRECTVSPEYLWNLYLKQNKKCAISGVDIRFASGSKQTASLDRIDNTKGYIEGNVQWVHKYINRIRSDFSVEYFKSICQTVINNREIEIQCVKTDPKAQLPTKSEGNIGWDIYCIAGKDADWQTSSKDSQKYLWVQPGQRVKINTGICLAILPGYGIILFDRSGLSVNKGMHRLAGVIDSSYRGELIVCLINLGEVPVVIEEGDRVCQGIIQEEIRAQLIQVDKLSETERGEKGFGSSGS